MPSAAKTDSTLVKNFLKLSDVSTVPHQLQGMKCSHELAHDNPTLAPMCEKMVAKLPTKQLGRLASSAGPCHGNPIFQRVCPKSCKMKTCEFDGIGDVCEPRVARNVVGLGEDVERRGGGGFRAVSMKKCNSFGKLKTRRVVAVCTIGKISDVNQPGGGGFGGASGGFEEELGEEAKARRGGGYSIPAGKGRQLLQFGGSFGGGVPMTQTTNAFSQAHGICRKANPLLISLGATCARAFIHNRMVQKKLYSNSEPPAVWDEKERCSDVATAAGCVSIDEASPPEVVEANEACRLAQGSL